MKGMRSWFSALPVRWKLTFWSALLLFVLFAAGSLAQYLFVEKWMLRQEEERIERDMRELLNVLLAKEIRVEPEHYQDIRAYLDKVNARNGMIRILTEQEEAVVVVADNMPQDWVTGGGLSDSGATPAHIQNGMLVIASPLTVFQFKGTVEIVRSLEDIHRLIAILNRIMLICGAVALVLSGIGGRWLAIVLLNPLRTMNDAMIRVKQNGLQERMPVAGPLDDVNALKIMFNDMMDQVEQSFRRQKQFVEDASHELHTPIAIMEGHLNMLKRWGKNDPEILEQSLNSSTDELIRLKRLVEELLLLSRTEKLEDEISPEEACVDLAECIRAAVGRVSLLHPTFDMPVCLQEAEGIAALIGESRLEQILQIVLDNAIKYSGESRTIAISAGRSDGVMTIDVIDFGIGISAADMPFVWDRFYRADSSRSGRSGYGLGLPIAKRLAESAGCKLELQSELGKGTTARLTVPISDPR